MKLLLLILLIQLIPRFSAGQLAYQMEGSYERLDCEGGDTLYIITCEAINDSTVLLNNFSDGGFGPLRVNVEESGLLTVDDTFSLGPSVFAYFDGEGEFLYNEEILLNLHFVVADNEAMEIVVDTWWCLDYYRLPVGILEFSGEGRINIWPNPAGSFVNLQYNQLVEYDVLKVLNAQGQVCLAQGSLESIENLQLDLSKLPNGFYTLLLLSDESLQSESFVVDR